jgi:F-type H+-transporting ATPase subunit alpha
MVVYAGTQGFLDDVPVNRVQEFQNAFLAYVDSSAPQVRQNLGEKRELTKDIEDQLKQALNDFKSKAWKK